ncbi:MAG TPA: nitrate/nitrite transporter NrtS [Actinomycetota bacterium]|jgi:hypothetical protein
MEGQNRRLTWSTGREFVAVVTHPRNLRRTVTVAVIVGTAFFAMNQLPIVLAGRATALLWCKTALTYLTPFLMSNFGILSATRRPARALIGGEQGGLAWH